MVRTLLSSFSYLVAGEVSGNSLAHTMSLKPSPFVEPKTGGPMNHRFTASTALFPPLNLYRKTALPSFLLLSSRKTAFHALCRVPAVAESKSAAVTEENIPDPPVRIVAIVGHGSTSPLKSATWEEVMLHTVIN